MAPRTVSTSVGSMPISTSSARRLAPFTLVIFWILLSIFQMIVLKPLRLVLSNITGSFDATAHESSTDFTHETRTRNLHTVVQSHHSLPTEADIHNDNVLDLPAPPAEPRRYTPPLMRSFNGIPLESIAGSL